MGRAVTSNDDWKGKILKNIPSELVGAYIALLGIIMGENAKIANLPRFQEFASLIVTIIICLLTPVYLIKTQNLNFKIKEHKIQLVLTTISFIVWSYTLGGNENNFWKIYGLHYNTISSILLILWSLVVALVSQPEKKIPTPGNGG